MTPPSPPTPPADAGLSSRTGTVSNMVDAGFIARLILQDMRHSRLTAALERAGLDTEAHTLDILPLVAQCLGHNPDDIPDAFIRVYLCALERAALTDVSSEALLSLAEEAAEMLATIPK